jgi:hypothetical protein
MSQRVIVALQTATRAAAQSRRVFIRKMRPFEESHTFALMLGLTPEYKYAVLEQPL